MLSVGPIPTPVVLLLIALIAAAVIGRRASKKDNEAPVSLTGTFFDMLLVGLLVGRFAFVLQWLPLYLADPWSIIRLGDGGYSLWAAVAGGLAYGVWRARRRPQLRRPLLWGSVAGLATWAILAGALLLMQRSVLQLPSTELTRIEGGVVRLPELAGQPMVVNLWATWCPPCRREMPVLAAGQAENPGVTFVFVNQGEAEHEVRGYLEQGGLQLRNVLLDAFSGVSQATGARAMPTTLFFDRDGRLVDTHMGELTRAGLAQKLQRFESISSAPASTITEAAR
ncbi:MAG: TlpA disulfide reductase family protein [Thermomonas sp.]